ncbi:Biotin--protein ligase [hydrothermal vent metagenome]|uniref:Biotin--protein ligase n=1 Tax=hydrothermal vent metagenome TaxID=652676 RepID=A0A3B0TMT3_9ZZZZ
MGFATLASTNSSAMEAAREGNADRLWVASLAQSKGRGRRGRVWQSEAGNLAASLVNILPKNVADPSLLSFVAALAVVNALEAINMRSVSARFELKWPNDVLANGAKIAGILLEAERLKSGDMLIVTGIGVNVKTAPGDLPYAATSLAQLGIDIDAQGMFEALSDAWVAVFDLWNNGAGKAQILDQWRARATGIGQRVAVKRAHDQVAGIFEAIDGQGQLVVRQKSGQAIIITAGDVFFNHI